MGYVFLSQSVESKWLNDNKEDDCPK